MSLYLKKIDRDQVANEEISKFRYEALYRPFNLEYHEEMFYVDREAEIFGLYKEDRPIGCVGIKKLSDHTVRIFDFFIAIRERDNGYGKSLLDFAESYYGHNENIKQIYLETPSSGVEFFKEHGYEIKDTMKGEKDLQLIRMEKKFEDRSKYAGFPVYDAQSEKPLGIFVLRGEDLSVVKTVRDSFPQENILLFELDNTDESWMELAAQVAEDICKLSVFSPLLMEGREKFSSNVINLPRYGAECAKEETEGNKVLMVAPESTVQKAHFEKAFKATESGLNLKIVPLSISSTALLSEINPSIYEDLDNHENSLKDSEIDTLIIPDFTLNSRGLTIRRFIEDKLERRISYVDLNRVVTSALRRELVERKITNVTADHGWLTVYSEGPKRAKDKLAALAPRVAANGEYKRILS